ncbi:MAG: bifunctional DNA-formamidopyrimidine glycosylase/DNA-(apurinic or apyrimidinic site) lyase [Gemmatimonadota bacterium]|nr:MAG: bifunctional DNA-formamidopyrimidine glycosylase/DNA-(apurinic or apyrimidinic site) lyase [Gemmatimonadota bacterium]
MPELPEAETIARGLDAAIAGRRIERIKIHRDEVVEPMSPAVFRRRLRGRYVERVGRRAKWITALLDDGGRWVTQLRMTGRFTWGSPSPLRAEPHLSASFVINNGDASGVLRFYDTRRFGRMWVLNESQWAEIDARLGVEPLSEELTPGSLAELLAGSSAPIRNWLLDQRRVAGIGNIYAVEACYRARIDPRRPAGSLERNDVRRLHNAIRRVLGRAVDRRGTTFSDYRDVLGAGGEFQNVLKAYGREDEQCARCGGTIERIVLAGRSAFFCAGCQV